MSAGPERIEPGPSSSANAEPEPPEESHAGYVVVFLLAMMVMGLGVYEAVVSLTSPASSVLLPLLESLTAAARR